MSRGLTTNYDAVMAQGRLIVQLNDIAMRYVRRIVEAHKEIDPTYVHDPIDCNHMRIGTVQFLKDVHRHYTINFDMLNGYEPDELCRRINEALEHAASSGMFKEKWRPEWVSCLSNPSS